MKPFGSIVQHIREKKKMTIPELAKQCNISTSYLKQLESGERINPSRLIIDKICTTLSVPYAVISFLSLEDKDISSRKRISYAKIKPAVISLIQEFFL